MENYANETYTPYGGYRGAATGQPHEVPDDVKASSSESYYPPSEGGYQQQEQVYGSQQQYGYQQQNFAPFAEYSSSYKGTPLSGGARFASLVSYFGGWITGLIFLLLKRDNRFVRFHAMQSLIFFGTVSLVTSVFSHIPFLASGAAGLGFVSFICWIVLMVAAARGRYYKLPIIGDYAEKWALRN